MTNQNAPVPVLEFRNLVKQFPRPDGGLITVLDGINRSVNEGDFVTIVGPSGCGKSTLFNLILGTLEPTSGSVLLDGSPVSGPDDDRGIVFQRYGVYPHLTVLENVMLGGTLRRMPKAHWFSARANAARYDDLKKAKEYLKQVRLDDSHSKYPHELSGGQRQRVAIAQSLFKQPRILLMDEPFGALDENMRLDAQLFLLELWEKYGLTVLFITHSLEEAVFMGTRVMALSQFFEHSESVSATENGSRFVLEYDMSSYINERHHQGPKRYVNGFTNMLSQIEEQALTPTVLQHMSEFFAGDPNGGEASSETA